MAAVAAVGLFGLASLRAAQLSLTHDEAHTYLHHVLSPVQRIIRFDTGGFVDNNHLLNTLGAKLATSVFGEREWAIRLPALSGYALFLAATLGLLRRHLGGPMLMVAFLAIAAHPYLMDFFSIARGYSLGLGFMALALWLWNRWLVQSIPIHRSSNAWGAGLAMLMASLANLSFLLPTAAAILSAATLAMQHRERGWMRTFAGISTYVAGTLGAALVVNLVPLNRIHEKDLFNIGGRQGFLADTVTSLFQNTLPFRVDEAVLHLVSAHIVIGIMVWAAYVLRFPNPPNGRQGTREFLLFMWLFTIAMAFGSIVQTRLFAVAYLTDRRALFLVPAFLIITFLTIDRTLSRGRRKSGLVAALLAITIALPYVPQYNLTHYRDWRYDAETDEIMRTVSERLEGTHRAGSGSIGVNWILEPSVNYYLRRYGIDELGAADRRGLREGQDFYIEHLDRENEVKKRFNVEIIGRYPLAGMLLAAPVGKRPEP
ncbi:MAG: hypothetical protein KDI88_08505 [Gammaproteobacteria bacterium]|nr:hypothetical protein [Gammaproteobacteria bacterium]